MTRIASVYEGEDVPITVEYVDPDTGDPTDPDEAPTVTVTAPDDTAVVDAVAMTADGTGNYEHVWDTAGEATGVYEVDVSAEFDTETKIDRVTVEVE